MKNRSSFLFIFCFFMLCLIPSLGMLIFGESKAGANEVLAFKPSLTEKDGSLNLDYPADLSDYIEDRFAFRQELITANARLNAALFRSSSTSDVIIGKDGWLFYAPTLPDYTGSDPMTPRELWCAARTLFLIQESAENSGNTFLFTVAPNKNSLYGEYMPASAAADAEIGNAEALFSLLNLMGVRYLDLSSLFSAEDEILYFLSDSHWNGKGAALAADALLQAEGKNGSYFTGPFEPAIHSGDLFGMLYPSSGKTEADFRYAPGFSFEYSSASSDADSMTLSTFCPGANGRLMMYRDSFGRNLYPYLANSYGTAVFSRKVDFSPVTESPSDVVIELVERNLRYLYQYSPTFPAPQRESITFSETQSGKVSISVGKSPMDGFIKITGTFSGVLPDDTSMVYIIADGKTYEAVPSPGGFSACLSGADSETPELSVVITTDGRNVCFSDLTVS